MARGMEQSRGNGRVFYAKAIIHLCRSESAPQQCPAGRRLSLSIRCKQGPKFPLLPPPPI